MISLSVAISFFATAVLLAYAPGPDIVFVLAQSAVYGAKAGLATTCGLMTGLCVHTALVTAGVAALIQASPTAFLLLKAAGALYLLYLAWLSWRAGAMRADGVKPAFPGCLALYRRGIFMNVTNPKVSIFFLAFLPQFVRPGAGDELAQLLGLSATFMLMTFVIFAIYGLLAHAFRKAVVESQQVQAWLRRGFAASFAGLGANLALADR